MRGFRCPALIFAAALGACGGPVTPPREPEGRAIAFGAVEPRNACFSCHGLNGEGRADAPRLAGLDAGYFAKQLEDYAQSTRPDDVMTPISQALNDRQRREVARYYSDVQIDRSIRSASDAPAIWYGDASRNIRPCAECHGQTRQGVPGAPDIYDQPKSYTETQLLRWRRSVRRNDAGDEMGRIARALTEAEIVALATYLEPET